MIVNVQSNLPFHRGIALICLSPDDLEWALDNSRREFLVRESVSSDHPYLSDLDEENADAIRRGYLPYQNITVIRLRDGRKWVFGGRSVRFPGTRHWPQGWRNTDEYARKRLAALADYKSRRFGGDR